MNVDPIQPLSANPAPSPRVSPSARSSAASTSSQRRHNVEARSLNPEDYAKRTLAYSGQAVERTVHPGQHYWNLANYLHSAFETHPDAPFESQTQGTSSNSTAYLRLHRLGGGQCRAQDMNTAQELQDLDTANLLEGKESHVLFIKGHPAPLWLNVLGGKYRVDPEFFLRHLRFRAAVGRPDHFNLPALPSATEGLMRVRLATIGYRQRTTLSSNQNETEKLRKSARNAMDLYHDALKKEAGWKIGDSIVREFSAHDEQHCSLEQEISIYVSKVGQSWIALVWSDCGNDLHTGPRGPWAMEPFNAMSWLPVVQYEPKVALTKVQALNDSSALHPRLDSRVLQSASLLPLAHACSMDKEDVDISMHVPFYALVDIYRFGAASQLQILNLLQSKLGSDLDPLKLIEQKNPNLSNLLYTQRILERHIIYIREAINAIETRGGLDSTAVMPKNHKVKADAALDLLCSDYKHLEASAVGMLRQCERGTTIIMNNAMLEESQRAISQAAGIAKLTKLAFIFIPLSFTSTFFGMNMAQLGVAGGLNVWVYFVTSAPIVLLSLLLMQIDAAKTWATLKEWVSTKWPRSRSQRGKRSLARTARDIIELRRKKSRGLSAA